MFLLGFVVGIVVMMVTRVIIYRANMIAIRRQVEIAEQKLKELIEKEQNGEFN